MTRHKHAQTGLVTPSPLDHWIDATLHVLAMLVLNVASTIRMRLSRPAVNATRQMPQSLPGSKTDTQSKEIEIAVQADSPISAHAEQRSFAARPSKHERVLTTLSTTPSVSLGSRQAIHLPQCSALMEANRAPTLATKGILPPPVRSTGGGGLRALARKTEGAPAKPTVRLPNVSVLSQHAKIRALT